MKASESSVDSGDTGGGERSCRSGSLGVRFELRFGALELDGGRLVGRSRRFGGWMLLMRRRQEDALGVRSQGTTVGSMEDNAELEEGEAYVDDTAFAALTSCSLVRKPPDTKVRRGSEERERGRERGEKSVATVGPLDEGSG